MNSPSPRLAPRFASLPGIERAGAFRRDGVTTSTVGPSVRGTGRRRRRWGMDSCGTASAAMPRRSRWALTARAWSSSTPSFSVSARAMLPGIARQW